MHLFKSYSNLVLSMYIFFFSKQLQDSKWACPDLRTYLFLFQLQFCFFAPSNLTQIWIICYNQMLFLPPFKFYSNLIQILIIDLYRHSIYWGVICCIAPFIKSYSNLSPAIQAFHQTILGHITLKRICLKPEYNTDYSLRLKYLSLILNSDSKLNQLL